MSTALLECDSPTEYILNGFRQLKSMIAQDGRDHDFTVLFKEPFRRGITFMVTGSVTQQFLEKAEGYCKLKKYQTRSKEWVLITVETDGPRITMIVVCMTVNGSTILTWSKRSRCTRSELSRGTYNITGRSEGTIHVRATAV